MHAKQGSAEDGNEHDEGAQAVRSGFKSQHWSDANGKPAGGITQGAGFVISWQNGPLGRCTCIVDGSAYITVHAVDCERKPQSGAFVEDVIDGARDRIAYYQDGEFACSENELALHHLDRALEFLHSRTRGREARGVEGTHAV